MNIPPNIFKSDRRWSRWKQHGGCSGICPAHERLRPGANGFGGVDRRGDASWRCAGRTAISRSQHVTDGETAAHEFARGSILEPLRSRTSSGSSARIFREAIEPAPAARVSKPRAMGAATRGRALGLRIGADGIRPGSGSDTRQQYRADGRDGRHPSPCHPEPGDAVQHRGFGQPLDADVHRARCRGLAVRSDAHRLAARGIGTKPGREYRDLDEPGGRGRPEGVHGPVGLDCHAPGGHDVHGRHRIRHHVPQLQRILAPQHRERGRGQRRHLRVADQRHEAHQFGHRVDGIHGEPETEDGGAGHGRFRLRRRDAEHAGACRRQQQRHRSRPDLRRRHDELHGLGRLVGEHRHGHGGRDRHQRHGVHLGRRRHHHPRHRRARPRRGPRTPSRSR